MKILLTTTSGTGHLHPLVPLARGAAEAGHSIRVAAPMSLAPTLASRGLPHQPLPDYGPEHLARVDDVMRRLGPPGPGAELPMLREVFGWAKTDATLHAMRDAVATWRPDLVLHEAAELSGPMAAELTGVPHATVAIGLRRTLTAWLPYATEGAAPLATAAGLPGDPDGRRILDVPFATLVPPGLEEPGSDMPDVVVRYQLTDVHGPAEVVDLRGRGPLVWVALGTEVWNIPGLVEHVGQVIAAAAGILPHVRFLLTTGSEHATVPTMPTNVQVAGYVPQEQVIEACDAVLGHGGFNTTLAALARGRPAVVMPLFATDQFETAARIDAVGAGVAVTTPTPDVLAAAVERSLTDPDLAAAAGALAGEMARLPTPGEAIDRLLRAVPRATPAV